MPQDTKFIHTRPNRFEAVAWSKYDPRAQLYLHIGPRPRVRDHYRAAKVAFWLELVPHLHGLAADPAQYGGSTTRDPARDPGSPSATSTRRAPPARPRAATRRPAVTSSSSSAQGAPPRRTRDPATPDGAAVLIETRRGGRDYATELSVTIAVGASLLLLNVLAFAALYYKKDKRRRETHRRPAPPSGPAHGHAPRGAGHAPSRTPVASEGPAGSGVGAGSGLAACPSRPPDYTLTLRRSPDDVALLPGPPPGVANTVIPGSLSGAAMHGFNAFAPAGAGVGSQQGGAVPPHGHSTTRV